MERRSLLRTTPFDAAPCHRARLKDISEREKKIHDAVRKLEVPKAAEAARKNAQETTGDAAPYRAWYCSLTAFPAGSVT